MNKQQEAKLIYAFLLLADFSSLIGCAVVLLAFWKLELLRNHITRIISCFCITSFIKDVIATSLTLEAAAFKTQKWACYLYAASINFGSFSCWMWTLCLALSIYLLVSRVQINQKKFEIFYMVASWGIPAISTIMLSSNIVSNVGSWCWIGTQFVYYRFGLFYIPFFIIFGVSAILVAMTSHYTYRVLHSRYMTQPGGQNNDSKSHSHHALYQFKLVNYIIVFLVCWVFAVVNRVLNAFNLNIFATNLLHTYLSVSHGFYASLVFIYNNPIMWRFFCQKVLAVCVFIGFGHKLYDYYSKSIDNNQNYNTRGGRTRGITMTKRKPTRLTGIQSQNPTADLSENGSVSHNPTIIGSSGIQSSLDLSSPTHSHLNQSTISTISGLSSLSHQTQPLQQQSSQDETCISVNHESQV